MRFFEKISINEAEKEHPAKLGWGGGVTSFIWWELKLSAGVTVISSGAKNITKNST